MHKTLYHKRMKDCGAPQKIVVEGMSRGSEGMDHDSSTDDCNDKLYIFVSFLGCW